MSTFGKDLILPSSRIFAKHVQTLLRVCLVMNIIYDLVARKLGRMISLMTVDNGHIHFIDAEKQRRFVKPVRVRVIDTFILLFDKLIFWLIYFFSSMRIVVIGWTFRFNFDNSFPAYTLVKWKFVLLSLLFWRKNHVLEILEIRTRNENFFHALDGHVRRKKQHYELILDIFWNFVSAILFEQMNLKICFEHYGCYAHWPKKIYI